MNREGRYRRVKGAKIFANKYNAPATRARTSGDVSASCVVTVDFFIGFMGKLLGSRASRPEHAAGAQDLRLLIRTALPQKSFDWCSEGCELNHRRRAARCLWLRD